MFDIDYAFTGDPSSLDSELFVYDPTTGQRVPSFFENLDHFTNLGGGGSIDGPIASRTPDAYLVTFFPGPGTYVVGVGRFDSVGSPGGITGNAPLLGQRYTLNISLEDHAVGGGGITGNGDRSFYFGEDAAATVPQGAMGQLVSNPFSLAGYSAQDLPNLYFNYYLNNSASSDAFRVYVDDGSATPTLIASSNSTEVSGQNLINIPQTSNDVWRQMRLDLGAFAEKENLQLRFEYEDGSAALSEGVYIDDLIIGFAERGEMVTFPPPSARQFPANISTFTQVNTPPGEVLVGDYQLEIRPTSPFGRTITNSNVSLILSSTLDTNDRLAEQTTLVALDGSLVVDGQTFAINDGVNEVVFEYEDPELGNGVAAGNVEIRFKSFDSTLGMFLPDLDHVIARRIRDAVNSPQVQSRLDITAASSDGEESGTVSTSSRIDLFGGAIVAQPDPFSITDVTNDANLLRDVIAGNGIALEGTPKFTGGATSAGLFTGGLPIFEMERGIILSTGDARSADGPNATDTLVGRASLAGDQDLDAEFGLDPMTGPVTEDTTSLEFDFRMVDGIGLDVNGTLNLNFVFASEEYNEQVGTDFTDVLAIFVDGQNIALVPGTTDPVSVATVNSGNPFDSSGATGQNPTFYVNNDPQENGEFLSELGYDGLTRKMTASLPLLAGVHSIKIVVSDVGDTAGDSAVFIEANSLADTQFVLPPTGIQNIRHTGFGDMNLARPQGQVKIHSNTITQPKTAGIVADAGLRGWDGQVSTERDAVAFIGFDGIPSPIRLQQPSPGPARNLVAQNNTPSLGGFTPGVSIVNNTIDTPGLLGIHVSGDTVPWELTTLDGDSIIDATTFTVTAFGQSVTFEWEDINGIPDPLGGVVNGGEGWRDGNIPVFYMRGDSSPHAFCHPIINPSCVPRSTAYTPQEVAIAVKDAIDNSILVSNDSTLVAQAIVGVSRISSSSGILFSGDDPAVYVEHASSIGGRGFASIRPSALGRAPQPFSKVVNNTIFGNNGTASSFPEANVEPNDTLFNAIDTRQGTQRTPESYIASGRIDDSVNFRENSEQDVDFYQFELHIGDRVTIDVDANTIGSGVDAILRLFDSVGEELAVNFNAAAPGEAGVGNDPFLDFTATENGTYYAAVSSFGNDQYSPLSLADRVAGGSTGIYDIEINVRTPRTFIVELQHTGSPGVSTASGTLTIEDVAGNVATVQVGTAARHPEVAVNLAASINGAGSLSNRQDLPNGAFGVANPLQRVTAEAFGSISQDRFGTDRDTGAPRTNAERYVVIRNAVDVAETGSGFRVIGSASGTPFNNIDDLLVERGILVSEQATPTLLNNIVANTQVGIQQAQFIADSRGPADDVGAIGGLVVGGTLYQNNETQDSNLPLTVQDFNESLAGSEPLFVNAAAGDFLPAPFSFAIDSAIDSLIERDEFESIKDAVGLALSPVLAPDIDGTGQLRVDDPEQSTPQGFGGQVFKDRGALDRADFVGPSVTLVNPQDNDSQGIDIDPSLSIVQLDSGVYSNFSLQIVDGFEAADPFPGIGVNDETLEGRIVPIGEEGLQLDVTGPAITLFQNGVFLREGIDYTYRFNTTSNTIVLTPLSGIWPNDKVYEISVNNRDRFVIDAAGGRDLDDTSAFKITNDLGDTATFEFDKGFSLTVAKTLGLQVPASGASANGIVDGQQFTINDGSLGINTPVIFEFDQNNNWSGNARRIAFPAGGTADEIADAIVSALANAHLPALDAQGQPLAIQPEVLSIPLLPRNLGSGLVHVGATDAHRVDVGSSALTSTVAKTVLRVPQGPQLGTPAVQDGETFFVDHAGQLSVFEYEQASRTAGFIASTDTMITVVDQSAFPANAPFDIRIEGEQLRVTQIFPSGGNAASFTVQRGVNGTTAAAHLDQVLVTNAVLPANAILFANSDSRETIATATANALSLPLSNGFQLGLNAFHVGSGIIELSGITDHIFNVASSGLVATIGQVPVGITVPEAGAAAIMDNETFTVSNGAQTFIFELSNDGLASTVAGSVVIPFGPLDSADAIANTIAGFLNTTADPNGDTLAMAAIPVGNGVIRLDAQPNHTIDVSGTILTRQVVSGGVRDGEVITLRENATATTIEFNVLGDTNFSTTSRNFVVEFSASDTHLDLAQRITDKIVEVDIGLAPKNAGAGEINLGGVPGIHQLRVSQPSSFTVEGEPGVSPSTTLILPSQPGIQVRPEGALAFADRDTFTISNGFVTAVFEIDKDGVFDDLNGDMLPDNFVVALNPGDTQQNAVDAILVALSAANIRFNLGLAPVDRGSGVIALNAPVDVVLFTNGLTAQNLLTSLVDGDSFTINDGTRTVTFEFEDLSPVSGTPNGIAGSNVAITFVDGSFVETVSNAMQAAIAGANIGVNPTLPNPGSGRVELGDSTRHLTDVSNSSLTIDGFAGGAIGIEVRTTFTEAEVAAAIIAGVNGASSRVEGVDASLRGGSTVFVDISDVNGQPANFVSGFAAINGIDNFFLSAVKDLAGNSLKGNQSTDETVFTILLPGVGLDFGDAPDPFAGSGNYPTLFDSNGARHVIGENSLQLGSGIDAELDGQQTLAADGDESDHSIQLLDSNISLLGLPPFSVQVPAAGGAALTPGESFTIGRRGRSFVTFTFVLGTAANSSQIGYGITDTADEIADKIVTAVEGQQSSLALRPSSLGNGLVALGGTSGLNIGVANSSFTLTGEPLRQLILPLRLVVSDAASISDGDQFVVSDGVGLNRIYEFDKNASGVPSGVVPINLTGSEDADAVAAVVIAAVTELSGVANAGIVTFSGLGEGHTIDVSGAATLAVDRSLASGESFIIDDGLNPAVVFEVSVDGAAVTAGNVSISISSSSTDAEVIEAIRSIVESQQSQLTGLTPLAPNDHTVTLAHHRSDSLDLSTSSLAHANLAPVSLQTTGAGLAIEIPSVARLQMPANGGVGITDSQFFTINDGINPVSRFEFADDGAFSGILLSFNASLSTQNLVDLVLTSLQTEIAAGRLTGITPVDLGNGTIDLQPVSRVRVDATGTNGSIQQTTAVSDGDAFTFDDRVHSPVVFEFDLGGNGVSVGARAVDVALGDSADDIAAKLEAAIKNATLAPNVLGTPDKPVVPVSIGNGVVDLSTGDDAILTPSIIPRTPADVPHFELTGTAGGIADGQQFMMSDGNRSWTFEFNRNGRFVEGRIQIPFASGDDANSVGAALSGAIDSSVPTLAASDLGNGVVLLQVADEDGVRFDGILVPGQSTPITVTSNGNGFLDAWFDFNHDGDWNDPGEQVIQNAIVQAGENSLSVTVPQVLPSNSPLGDTYARFRLSSAGSLLPTGLAVDGEVEDYKVRVLNNSAPVANQTVLVDFTAVEDGADTVADLLNPPAFDDINLNDGNGDFLTFAVGTRVLSVEQDGMSMRDGDTITIFAADGVDSRTFEFDNDGIVTSGNVSVPFTLASTAAEIGVSLASQIESQDYGLTVSTGGASILLTGEGSVILGPVFTGVTVSTGLSLEVLQDGGTLEDGGTVTVVAANNLESRTFEFDNDGFAAAGNVAVPFDVSSTRADLAGSLIAEINRIADQPLENYGIGAVVGSTNDAVVRFGGEGSISFGSVFDGVVETTDATLRVVQDGLNFTEAGTVTITPTFGVPTTFEFTSDGIFTFGNTQVVFDTTRTPEQIAGILAQAITLASFGVVATVDPLEPTLVRLSGSSNIALGAGFADLTIGTANGLQLRKDGTALPDDATITIATADGLSSRTFELDSNGSVAPGNLPVVFDSSSTTTEIMDRFAAQIATANFGVIATSDALDGAILRLSGSGVVSFDFDFQDLRLVSDEPILIPSIDIDGQTLRLEYQPDQNGTVNLTVRATDQGGLFAERTIQVVVAPGNDVPIATGVADATLVTPNATCVVSISDMTPLDGFNETISLCEDQAIVVTLRGDDGDPLPLEKQRLTFENFDQSNANGAITGITSNTGDLGTGQFIYTPNVNFAGFGEIVFTVRDDGSAGAPFQQASTPFTLTLDVASVNDPPTGTNQIGVDALATTEDTSVMITLAGDDDGNILTTEMQALVFTIAEFPAHGTFLSGVDVDGSVTGVVGRVTSVNRVVEYQPELNFNNDANSPIGPDSFTFNVTDDGTPAETSVAPATVEINVSEVNDAPVPEVILASTTTSTICQPFPGTLMLGADLTQGVSTCEDHVTTLTLGGSTGDNEAAQTLTFTLISGPSEGSLGSITPTSGTEATVVYSPDAGFNGSTTIVVRATDDGETNGVGDPLSEDLTITITVEPINAPPVALDKTVTTPEDSATAIALTADDGDPGVEQALRFFVELGPANNFTRTANGTLSGVNASTGEVIGQLIYTPDLNFNGADAFTFVVQDDALAGNPAGRFSVPATVDIDVSAVNDRPIANPQTVITNEDLAVVVALTGDDGDPNETQSLSYEIAMTPANGTLNTADIANGNVSYTPSANFNGTDSFTFRVSDDGTNPDNLLSTEATVMVTVNPLNDEPEFTIGQPITVLEDSGSQTIIAWTSGIRPGPTTALDEAGQIVSFMTSNNNTSLFLASGQPTVSSSGTLTYTPAPNAVGQAVLTIVATDSGNGVSPNDNTSAAQTVILMVSPVNDAPQFIKGPNQSTNEDSGLQTVPIWASNIAPGPVQASDESTQMLDFVVNVVTTGNLSFDIPPTISTAPSTLGQLTYLATPDTNGTATVTVTLRDGGPGSPPDVNISPTETFSITVNPINDAPEFTPGSDVVVDEDAGLVRITDWATGIRPGPAIATDENSQALSFIANPIGFTGGLTFTTAPLVDPLTGDLLFQTSPNKWGTATVTVRLRDTGAGTSPHDNESAIHTLNISVNSVNDPPEFTLGANRQITEDASNQTVFGFVSSIRPGPASANDEAGQSISFNTTNDNNSLFAVQPTVAANGTLSYSPASNRNGVAIVNVEAEDTGANVAPSDNTSSQQFTITINAVNDAPSLIVPGAQSVAEDTLKAIGGISAADIDAAEGTGEVQLEFRATSGTLNLNTNIPGGVLASQVTDNGSSTVSVLAPLAQINTTLAHANAQSQPDGLSYEGNANFHGQDQIVITVDDLGNTGSPGVRTISRTVPITVTPVNDPPVLANPVDDITVDEDAPVTLVELFPQVFSDPDVLSSNDQLTIRVVGNSNQLVASTVINGTALELTPLEDAFGEARITIEAADTSGEFAQDTFTFFVLPVNDAPTVVNDSYTVPGSSPAVLTVLSNDSDKDSVINPATVAIGSAASGGGVAVNGNGTITFTPNIGFHGQTSFTYLVSDSEGATSQPATVTVTVNEPPVANADATTTNQGVAVAIPVLENDTDSDGSVVTTSVAISQQPANGSVLVNPTGVVTYTPNSAFSGTDTFQYTVSDDIGGVSAPGTVSVTVVPFRPWQNPADQVANGADGALDVSDDGFVSAIDALLVINQINTQGTGPLADPTPGNEPPPAGDKPFVDVNGDGQLSPIDSLLVINFLNSAGSNQGEGEAVSLHTDVLATTDDAGAAAVLVSEFAPGYRQSRYAASSEMPPALHDEVVAPWSVANRLAADSLVESKSDRYRDEIRSSREEAYLVGAELDDVLTDLAWDHASDDELPGHEQTSDAALTDLLEQDLLSDDS